jgi:nudix-type nucleoside diphosphatase (YffH/AdpP family)
MEGSMKSSQNSDTPADRVRNPQLTVLSDQHYVLRRAEYDFRRRDGRWQKQIRESYDIGDGAAVLPVDPVRGTVILIRQFRWPLFERGERRLPVEAIAGKLDGDDPLTCVVKEAREEAGIAILEPRCVFRCFMSPGAVKEELSLFVARYDAMAARENGGGATAEGEDIEVLEIPVSEAHAMVEAGLIRDAKTVILLQWLALNPGFRTGAAG